MHWRQGMFKVPPPLSLLVETTFFCSYYLIVIMATKTINCCFPQPTVPWPGLAWPCTMNKASYRHTRRGTAVEACSSYSRVHLKVTKTRPFHLLTSTQKEFPQFAYACFTIPSHTH